MNKYILIGLMLLGCGSSNTPVNTLSSEESAKEFVQKLGYKTQDVQGISCGAVVGYFVNCSVRIIGQTETIKLQCPEKDSRTFGCHERNMMIAE